MIVEYIQYVLSEHQPSELIEAYQLACAHLRAAPECLGYELSQCEQQRNSLTLRITWQSTQAHMEGFRKGGNFPPFLERIRPFIHEIVEMRHYAPTELVWARDERP